MKKILSWFLLITMLFASIWNSYSADSTTTTIEWTNINVTSSTEWWTTSTTSSTPTTSTVDNSVSISWAWTALSSFTDWLMQDWIWYESWDFNWDNIPDVIVFRNWYSEFYEYSAISFWYILSATINTSTIKNYFSKAWISFSNTMKVIWPESYLSSNPWLFVHPSLTYNAMLNDLKLSWNPTVYFTVDWNWKNKAIIKYLAYYITTWKRSSGRNSATITDVFGTTSAWNALNAKISSSSSTLWNITSINYNNFNATKFYEIVLETTANVKKMGFNVKSALEKWNFPLWTNNENTWTYFNSKNWNIVTKWLLDVSTDLNSDDLSDLLIYEDPSQLPNQLIENYVYSVQKDRYILNEGWTSSTDSNWLWLDINNDTQEDALFYTDADDTWTIKNLLIYINNNWNYTKSLDIKWISWVSYIDLNNDDNSTDFWAKDLITYTKVWDTYKYQVYVYNPLTLTYTNVLEPISFLNWLSFSTSDVNWDWNLDLSFVKNDWNTYVYTYWDYTEGSMTLLTTIEGGSYKYLKLNSDNYLDLITRSYLWLFSWKNFYEFKIYYFNSSTNTFEVKNSSTKIIWSNLNAWYYEDDSTIEDFNNDWYKDLILEWNETKAIYYYWWAWEYTYLNKIKNDIDNTKYIFNDTNWVLEETDLLLIDNNNKLIRYIYNTVNKLYEKDNSYYNDEILENNTFEIILTDDIHFNTVASIKSIENWSNWEKLLLIKDKDWKLSILSKRNWLIVNWNLITWKVTSQNVNSSNVIFNTLWNYSTSISNNFNDTFNSYDWEILSIWELWVYLKDWIPEILEVDETLFTNEDVYFSTNVQWLYDWNYIPLIESPSIKLEEKTLAELIRTKVLNWYNFEKIKTIWYLNSTSVKNVSLAWEWTWNRWYVCDNSTNYWFRITTKLNGSNYMGIQTISWTESCLENRPHWGSRGRSSVNPICWNSRGNLCKRATWTQNVKVTEFTYKIENLLGANKFEKDVIIYASNPNHKESLLWEIDKDINNYTIDYNYWHWGLSLNQSLDNYKILIENSTENISLTPATWTNKMRAYKTRNWMTWRSPACTDWNWTASRRSNVYYKTIWSKTYCYTWNRSLSISTKNANLYKGSTFIKSITIDKTTTKTWNIPPVKETISSTLSALPLNTTVNNFIIERKVNTENVTIPSSCPSQNRSSVWYHRNSNIEAQFDNRVSTRGYHCKWNIEWYNASWNNAQYWQKFSLDILRQSLFTN